MSYTLFFKKFYSCSNYSNNRLLQKLVANKVDLKKKFKMAPNDIFEIFLLIIPSIKYFEFKNSECKPLTV